MWVRSWFSHMSILPIYHLSHALRASPLGMFFFIVTWACQAYYILVLCLWVRSWLSHMSIPHIYHLSHTLRVSPLGMFITVTWACQVYYILVLCLWVQSWLSHISIPHIYHSSQALWASPLGMFLFYSRLGMLNLLYFSTMFVGLILVLSYFHPTFLLFELCLKS